MREWKEVSWSNSGSARERTERMLVSGRGWLYRTIVREGQHVAVAMVFVAQPGASSRDVLKEKE